MKYVTSFEALKEAEMESVTDFCRWLIEKDLEVEDSLVEVYRGEMLCLIVNDIRAAAEVEPEGTRWRKYRPEKRGEPRTDVFPEYVVSYTGETVN